MEKLKKGEIKVVRFHFLYFYYKTKETPLLKQIGYF